MPILINNDSGLAENLPDADAAKAAAAGTHQVPLVNNNTGDIEAFKPEDAASMVSGGTHAQPEQDQLGKLMKTAKYSGTGEQVKAGLEGVAQGVLGPLAPLAEKAYGVKGKDISGRAEVNPITHDVGMGVGLVGSSLADFGLGAELNAAGAATKAAVGLEKGATLFGSKAAATIAGAAAAGGVENALFQTQDEVSKFINGNPAGSVGLAAMNIGMAGLLGAGVGGALGTVPAGWDALMEGKVGREIANFKGRINQIKDIADPTAHLTDELQNYHGPLQEQALSEVYGKTGLRQQELHKILPTEMTPELSQHNTDTINKIGDALGEMQKNAEEYPAHNVKELQRQYEILVDANKGSPETAFNALNDFKRYAQGTYKALQRTDNFEVGYKFLNTVKNLGQTVRTSLEAEPWGAAGQRTKAINAAWAELQTPMKEFNSKFSTKLDDTKVIDPGKVSTYLNNLGKPNAEIKQAVLKNYLDASTKFRSVMDATHANLGIENPLSHASTSMAESTIGDITPGSKMADWLVHKGVGNVLAGSLGGAVGAHVGSATLGAMIGVNTLGRGMSKAFNSIVLPLIQKSEVSGAGARAAMDFAAQAIKGESKLNNLTEDVFKAGRSIISADVIQREQLKKKLADLQDNPGKLESENDYLGHYMPDHATALAQQKVMAGQYLQSLKPNTSPLGVLDPDVKPTKEAIGRYNAALDIANNPGIVLQKLRNGNLTTNDIKDLQGTNPALADVMRSKVTQQLIDMKHKGEQIPFKLQTGLSLFMAQPLSSNLSPAAIMASQPQLPAMAAQPPQAPKAGGGRHNYTSLQKMPGMYQTPQQSRTAYRAGK